VLPGDRIPLHSTSLGRAASLRNSQSHSAPLPPSQVGGNGDARAYEGDGNPEHRHARPPSLCSAFSTFCDPPLPLVMPENTTTLFDADAIFDCLRLDLDELID